MVPKREWGTKRLCVGCGERFYDLLRNPITCPGCGETHVPEVATKSRRAASAKPKLAAVTTKPTATLAVVQSPKVAAPGVAAPSEVKDNEDLVDTDADADADGVGDVMEDPSELGEDEDDMAEVIEGSREDKQD